MNRDESFDRTQRIRKRRDFLRIQSSRRKARSEHLLLAISGRGILLSEALKQGGIGSATPAQQRPLRSRIGITVTRKVDKRAVQRNRLKRCIREFFRREKHLLREPLDIVVIALEGAAALSFHQLAAELRFALRRAGVLAGEKDRGTFQRPRLSGGTEKQPTRKMPQKKGELPE
jgi:ribonuclease P protein component